MAGKVADKAIEVFVPERSSLARILAGSPASMSWILPDEGPDSLAMFSMSM